MINSPALSFAHTDSPTVPQNDLVRDTPTSGLLFNSSAAITDYTPPAPPAGSGPHRYVALCLQQPTNFTPLAELSIPGTGFGAFE